MSGLSNAITAKARAMLAEGLTASDYATMLQKKSVGEIAAYLQNHTLYKDSLEGINAKAIHRGQLEVLIRTSATNRFAKLIRYADDNAKQVGHNMVMPMEIDLILMKIRSLSDQENEVIRQNMISSLPLYISKYTSFSLKDLADSSSFAEILEITKNTLYFDVLKQYRQASLEEIDYISLEHGLRARYYDACLDTIDKYANNYAKEKMRELVLTNIELENFEIIYRLKKYFSVPKEGIKRMLSNHSCYFSMKDLYNMIETDTPEQMLTKLKNSRYKQFIKNEKFIYIEHFTHQIIFNMNLHFMRMYNEPNLALQAYVILAGTELVNVINVIEGVRYQIPQDRIKSMLIY